MMQEMRNVVDSWTIERVLVDHDRHLVTDRHVASLPVGLKVPPCGSTKASSHQ
jgi:hypothetical protein